MENLDYISVPVPVKAIQFKGTNWDEVKKVIELNGGEAKMTYLDKYGRPTDMITQYKMLVFKGAGASPSFQAHEGAFIILNGAEGGMFPYGEEQFKAYHVPTVGDISNGSHTFNELYKSLARFEPTLEEILVTDKFSLKNLEPIVQQFIKESATIHIDSEDKNYYVLHGVVYVD